uniref:Uncharacterized protein n=1 Tax=uncultured Acidobacteria bacterium HF4000_26D02 TaxID=710731 RepID=E0XW82_9BACT|nr:hypothetical protein [uncultured Acidobacteria bacterium HF4000_26D02]
MAFPALPLPSTVRRTPMTAPLSSRSSTALGCRLLALSDACAPPHHRSRSRASSCLRSQSRRSPPASSCLLEHPPAYTNPSWSSLSPSRSTGPSTVAASPPGGNRSRATRCTSSLVTRSTPCSVSSSVNCRPK